MKKDEKKSVRSTIVRFSAARKFAKGNCAGMFCLAGVGAELGKKLVASFE